MAVTKVVEIGFGRRKARYTDQYVQEYTRAFRVYLDQPTTFFDLAHLAQAQAFGLPQRWDPFPSDVGADSIALAKSIEVTETEEPTRWVAEVGYSSDVTDQSRESEDPLQEPPRIQWSAEIFQEAIDADINGLPIINTAGDWIEGIEIERSRPVLTYTDTVQSFSQDEATQFVNSINSHTFLNKAAFTWKCRRYDGERDFRNNIAFWRRTLEFAYQFDTWMVSPLNAGFRQLVGGVQVPIRDRGQPVAQPVPLANDGTRLPVGGTAIFLNFDVYSEQDFGQITNLRINF